MTFSSTDLIRVSARMQYGTSLQDLINVMFFEMLSPSSNSDANVLADMGELLEVLYTTILGQQNDQIAYIDYTVTNETQGTTPQTTTWPTLTAGSSMVDALPPQIAGLILGRTNVSRKQGRVFTPGFIDSAADGSGWVTAALTALANFGAELLVTQLMTNGNYRYGVASVAVTPPRDIVNSFDPAINAGVVAFTRTQRRRSTGFGS